MAINNIIKRPMLSSLTLARWQKKYLLGKRVRNKTLVTNQWSIWLTLLICYTARITLEEQVRAIWSLALSSRHSRRTLTCEPSNTCYSQKTSSEKLFSNRETKGQSISRCWKSTRKTSISSSSDCTQEPSSHLISSFNLMKIHVRNTSIMSKNV